MHLFFQLLNHDARGESGLLLEALLYHSAGGALGGGLTQTLETRAFQPVGQHVRILGVHSRGHWLEVDTFMGFRG
jgi:hypothetical protein